MEATDRPLESVEGGDIVLVGQEPRVVAAVDSASAGKSGGEKVTLEFAHTDDPLVEPAEETIRVVTIDRVSNPMIRVGGTDDDFDPRMVRVTVGTPVVWFWTGEGGTHRIVGEDFASMPQEDGGYTVERAYDEPGVYAFECEPHGSTGYVIVEATETA